MNLPVLFALVALLLLQLMITIYFGAYTYIIYYYESICSRGWLVNDFFFFPLFMFNFQNSY